MRKSRLSQHKLIALFVAGVTARTATELVNVNNIIFIDQDCLSIKTVRIWKYLKAKSKPMKVILVVNAKANVDVV